MSSSIHDKFNLSRFRATEKTILRKLSNFWFLTSSGASVTIGSSRYDYFFMKPINLLKEQFNLDREILCIFSQYENFEPRTLDAIENVHQKIGNIARLENICTILISKDIEIEEKIKRYNSNDPEKKIIIPFSYDEIHKSENINLYVDKLRRFFYSKDLFSFNSPLKKDIHFFGRSQLITELINKHYSGEHASIFGLRKSGKTSVVYAIQRKLEIENKKYISIDCESPSIHGLNWFKLLLEITKRYKEVKKSNYKIDESKYDSINAAAAFKNDFLKIYSSTKNEPVLIIFDEIERIAPNTSTSNHWKSEYDFILFWQTLRSVYQEHNNLYTYMLVGTNPQCAEKAKFFDHDNPIYASISIHYLPSFSLEQVQEMVTTLGAYMGMEFGTEICVKLKESCGGHPFLIRQVCSFIHKSLNVKRPITIDKQTLISAILSYKSNLYEYFDMMLNILGMWYPDEYELLILLALEDIETFEYYANDAPDYVDHLIKFGLVEKNIFSKYSLKIENLGDYLKEKNKFKRIKLNNEDKLQEVSLRRNRLEKKLREQCLNVLKIFFGKNAKNKVINSLESHRRKVLENESIEKLLSKTNSPLYFLDLKNIISREWESFKNLFEGLDKNRFTIMMEDINNCRADAHAKSIEDTDFNQLRLHFEKFEKLLEY